MFTSPRVRTAKMGKNLQRHLRCIIHSLSVVIICGTFEDGEDLSAPCNDLANGYSRLSEHGEAIHYCKDAFRRIKKKRK